MFGVQCSMFDCLPFVSFAIFVVNTHLPPAESEESLTTKDTKSTNLFLIS